MIATAGPLGTNTPGCCWISSRSSFASCSLLWTTHVVACTHLEGLVTWQHGVFVRSCVGFLGNKELPPEHAGVEKQDPPCKSGGARCRTARTLAVVTSQKSMHCTVMSFLLCVSPPPRWLHTIFSTCSCLFDTTQQVFLLTCFHRSAYSRFASTRLLILAISAIASPTKQSDIPSLESCR